MPYAAQVVIPINSETGFWHCYPVSMKTINLNVGDTVQIKAWGGKTLIRRVVSIRGDTVAVCCEEEYQAARSEGRQPTAIGFKLKDVTPLESRSSKAD